MGVVDLRLHLPSVPTVPAPRVRGRVCAAIRILAASLRLLRPPGAAFYDTQVGFCRRTGCPIHATVESSLCAAAPVIKRQKGPGRHNSKHMGAGASAQPLVPPPTEPKETGDGNDDSLTSVHDARLAALLRGAGTTKLTYSDSAFEALLARNLPSPLEWPPASETRRRRKTLDRLQELFGKASLSSRQAAQTVAQLMPDDDERDAVAEFLMARVDASARPAYVTALSRCEPPSPPPRSRRRPSARAPPPRARATARRSSPRRRRRCRAPSSGRSRAAPRR